MLIKVAAATNQAIDVTCVVRPKPNMKIPFESNRTNRRPYISESLPKSSVEIAPAKAGKAISHEKNFVIKVKLYLVMQNW